MWNGFCCLLFAYEFSSMCCLFVYTLFVPCFHYGYYFIRFNMDMYRFSFAVTCVLCH